VMFENENRRLMRRKHGRYDRHFFVLIKLRWSIR
jgi:hypothetical protein